MNDEVIQSLGRALTQREQRIDDLEAALKEILEVSTFDPEKMGAVHRLTRVHQIARYALRMHLVYPRSPTTGNGDEP